MFSYNTRNKYIDKRLAQTCKYFRKLVRVYSKRSGFRGDLKIGYILTNVLT